MKEIEELHVQGLMEELILLMIADEDAKSKVSFKYVSPEWIGRPGWYFWPKDRKGVFYIKMNRAAHREGGVEVDFDLYYYPHPDEDVFAGFSYTEQMVRVSELFSRTGVAFSVACECQAHCDEGEFSDLQDGKGVPVPELRESLHSWLYRVGNCRAFWLENQLLEWGVEAQFCSRTWGIVEVKAAAENGIIHVLLDKQEVDRDLPAWELTECFCINIMSDLEVIGMTGRVKEKIISNHPYAANKLVFSLTSSDNVLLGMGGRSFG